MEINTSGPYSPDTVYGQLTYPFKPTKITINAHTPYDKEDEAAQAVTLSSFRRNQVNYKYEREEEDSAYSFGLDTGYKPNQVPSNVETPEFPPKNVSSFSASSMSSKDIVNSAIQRNGYTAQRALVVAKAQKAYKTSAGITNDPISALNSRSFKTVKG